MSHPIKEMNEAIAKKVELRELQRFYEDTHSRFRHQMSCNEEMAILRQISDLKHQIDELPLARSHTREEWNALVYDEQRQFMSAEYVTQLRLLQDVSKRRSMEFVQ